MKPQILNLIRYVWTKSFRWHCLVFTSTLLLVWRALYCVTILRMLQTLCYCTNALGLHRLETQVWTPLWIMLVRYLYIIITVIKVKSRWRTYPVTGLDRLLRLQEVEAPTNSGQSPQEDGKVVNPTHRQPLPPWNIPGTHFLLEAGWITSMKNPNHPSGNQNPNLPACCAMPQPTAPLPTPHCYRTNTNLEIAECFAKQLVIAPVSLICVSKQVTSPISDT